MWTLALVGVTASYVSIFPVMGGEDLQQVVDSLPEEMTEALGYDQIGTAAGYISSTIYGLQGPLLLLIFSIGAGSRLIAGEEEQGILELELSSPVTRRRLYFERLLALWSGIAWLGTAIAATTVLLAAVLSLGVSTVNLLATSAGLVLLVAGLGTVAFAIGASTGRRSVAAGMASVVAVGAFMLDALGPTVGADWMTSVSPFSWYAEDSPIINGTDPIGLILLSIIPVAAALWGKVGFERRDLMV